MPADPISLGQEQDNDTLDALLIEALDGNDLQRAALLLRLALTRGDPDHAAELEHYRINGLPSVWRS